MEAQRNADGVAADVVELGGVEGVEAGEVTLAVPVIVKGPRTPRQRPEESRCQTASPRREIGVRGVGRFEGKRSQ